MFNVILWFSLETVMSCLIVDLKRKAAEAEILERQQADRLSPITLQGQHHYTSLDSLVEDDIPLFISLQTPSSNHLAHRESRSHL